MHERCLPASPNWYYSRCSDVSSSGLLGVGAKNIIYLIDVCLSSCRVVGELVGHKDLVSGVSFCQEAGQSHLCVSSSVDGTICFWDSDNRVLIKEHLSHQSGVTAVHWSPVDKNLVVSGDEKGVVFCHWFNTGDRVSFFPEPRTIFCLTCSPHTWSSVAVGYKDGMIVLIDVSKKGEVMHRLRGHDDEIHSLAWAPQASEDTHSRPEDREEEDEKCCYLASGSKDQTVRIWNTVKGKAVTTLKLPYLKKRGSAVEPERFRERLWLTVHWPKTKPTQLISSCFSGELLMWDWTKTGKQRSTVFGMSSDGRNHNRIVFNISSARLSDGRELIISTSMDREIKCWDLDTLECCWTLPTLGGFINTLTFSPVGIGCLALGVGDNMIRLWNTLTFQNHYDTRTLWQGIRSKVTALAWHPTREGSLSFGTDDGKVGIYDVFSNKPPQISSSYHRKTVYTLAWGPPLPPASLAEGKVSFSLFSCAGEGIILQHDPSKLNAEASDIDKLIKDTNNIKHKLSPHTDFSWKPDGKVVAVGNEDGCIEVYQAPTLKLLCSIQQHHKIINTLRWHHGHTSAPELHCLLASGSSNAIVYVHDLHTVIENPPDSPLVVTEPYRRLCGHTSKITSMAWSPHQNARLVTVSYDGTAQVWDVLQEAAVCNYRGHVGSLLCVDWSPVDPDVIWTGGKDFTVQEWRVSKQEFTAPPKGKKMIDLKEKSKQKKKNKKMMSGRVAPSELNGESVNGGGKEGEIQEPSEDEQEAGNTGSGPLPPPDALEIQRKCAAVKRKDKAEPSLLSLKKKKCRSLLPVSTSMDHRSKEELLQDCLTLASVTNSNAPPAGCVPGQGEHTHLGLFSDRAALYRMFQAEEEAHLEAGHHESSLYLRLWSGDLEGALHHAAEMGELSDHHLAVAPMAGFEVWRRTVEAFVRQLCLQEQYLKAAAHLLSINKLYEAVELLRAHKLYREAIALVKARLPAEEPVLQELYTCWAEVQERDGHLSGAAKCYLAAGASFEAAKVIAKKNDVSSLRTAASLARISGEAELAQSLALRCAKDLAAAQDWVGAQEVLSSDESLLVHRLHFCVAELLSVMLPDSVSQPCVSSHRWALPGKRCVSIQDCVLELWEAEFGVSGRTSSHLLQDLKSVDSPRPASNTPLCQVLLYAACHLTRALLHCFADNDDQLIQELWHAVSWIGQTGNFSAPAEFLRVLFPHGDASVCSIKRPKTLQHSDTGAKAAASSLQGALHYHRLYQYWWSNSPSNLESTEGNLLSNVESTEGNSASNFGSTEANSASNLESTDGNSPSNLESTEANSASNPESTEGNSASNPGSPESNLESTEGNSSSNLESTEGNSASNQGSTETKLPSSLVSTAAINPVTHLRSTDINLASNLNSTESNSAGNLGCIEDTQQDVSTSEDGTLRGDVMNGGLPRSGDFLSTSSVSKLDFDVALLLSEQHASCQATERAMIEIQDRLATMVLQNSIAQGAQRHPVERQEDTPSQSISSEETAERAEDQETLLSLSRKMSTYQKELDVLPETVKMFPHPDVMECCLVLLHLSSSSSCISEAMQQQAKELLRRFGTSNSVLKACQRFLT